MFTTVRRSHRSIVIALVVAFLAAGPALAHRKRVVVRPHVHTRAVIVVGKPRPARKVVVVRGTRQAIVDVEVKPGRTEVWVDGTYRGLARDLDGSPQKLHLAPGRHRIRLVTPDGLEVTREVKLAGGTEVDLRLDLRD